MRYHRAERKNLIGAKAPTRYQIKARILFSIADDGFL